MGEDVSLGEGSIYSFYRLQYKEMENFVDDRHSVAKFIVQGNSRMDLSVRNVSQNMFSVHERDPVIRSNVQRDVAKPIFFAFQGGHETK